MLQVPTNEKKFLDCNGSIHLLKEMQKTERVIVELSRIVVYSHCLILMGVLQLNSGLYQFPLLGERRFFLENKCLSHRIKNTTEGETQRHMSITKKQYIHHLMYLCLLDTFLIPINTNLHQILTKFGCQISPTFKFGCGSQLGSCSMDKVRLEASFQIMGSLRLT